MTLLNSKKGHAARKHARTQSDDLSENRESTIWCNCRDVSNVRTVFPCSLWASTPLLFSAQNWLENAKPEV